MKRNISAINKLVNLGLSKQEAEIYVVLQAEGPLPAKEIAQKVGILPHAVYRTAKKLLEKNLIALTKKRPLTYISLPAKIAFTSLVDSTTLQLQKDLNSLTDILGQQKFKQTETKVDVFFGKHETFMRSIKDFNEAKSEILIISIGEEISKELLLADKKAIKRGVKILLIVHKYDDENKEVIENFKLNGIKVRHYPDWGFHLVVCDSIKSHIIVNNPKNPTERVGIQIYSKGLSKALRDYFYSVWKKAVKV
jgi:sugar-specific transcriptional regulator TrmB